MANLGNRQNNVFYGNFVKASRKIETPEITGYNGSDVIVDPQNASGSNTGNDVIIRGGQGGPDNGTGGAVLIRGGAPGSTTASGGTIDITASLGGSTGGNGGLLRLVAGGANGTATGGDVFIRGGTSNDGQAGDVDITAGPSTGTGTNGSINLNGFTDSTVNVNIPMVFQNVTEAQRDAINAVTGMVVYVTDGGSPNTLQVCTVAGQPGTWAPL